VALERHTVAGCGTFLDISHFENFDPVGGRSDAQFNIEPRDSGRDRELKNMAQKQRAAEIAAQLGRSVAATGLKGA
jgi:hypothetical protein